YTNPNVSSQSNQILHGVHIHQEKDGRLCATPKSPLTGVPGQPTRATQ
ncbi:unnamed protein product, partial [Didymodactylos carnosus]